MIIRIVKLIIKREKVDEFQLFFEKTKPSISNLNRIIELLKETEKGNILHLQSLENEKMLKIIEIHFFQG